MSVPIQIPNSRKEQRDFDHNEFAYSYNPYRHDESPIYNYPNRFKSHSCPVRTTGTSPICPDKRMNVLQLISPNDTDTNVHHIPSPELKEENQISPVHSFIEIRQDKTKLPRELISELIHTPTPTSNTCENIASSTFTTTSSMDEYMIAYISSSESDKSGDSPKSITSKANDVKIQTDDSDIFPMDEDQNHVEERNEDWPFTDQTFEDIALYLWNKQEQDDLKEQVF